MGENIRVNSFLDYWRAVESIGVAEDEMLFFRGVGNCEYQCFFPGIRFDTSKTEDDAYHSILLEFPEEFAERKHLSNLVKMQHYGSITRLLDLSINPLFSLFFASEQNPLTDGKVCVLKVKKRDVLHHNSDKALMLSCLPVFTDQDKDEIKRFCECHPGEITDQDIMFHKPMRRFLHEIRGEYPAFETCIVGQDLLDSFFVMPNKDNDRMKIQDGAFVIFGLDIDKGQDFVQSKEVAEIIIHSGAKESILKSLGMMKITSSSVYSGLERTALYLRNKKLAWKSLNE